MYGSTDGGTPESRDALGWLLKVEEILFYTESVAIVFDVRKELNSDAVAKAVDTVSYTHLTLPTIYSV